MRSTKFSQLTNKLICSGALIVCVLAPYAGALPVEGIVTPTTVPARAAQSQNLPLVCTELDPGSLGAAGGKSLFWKNKSELRVRFLNGSEALQAQVRRYASIWNNYTRLPFVFVESGPSDIRVSFTHDGSSWSYIGKSAEGVSVNKPTMNFGWFDGTTTEDNFRGTILHEFGHGLGLIHEHLSPAAVIHWNKPKVYEYYDTHFGWNENLVNRNIFEKYGGRRTKFTPYDPTSIMHYPIPAELTTDGTSVAWNTNLSSIDKAFAEKEFKAMNK